MQQDKVVLGQGQRGESCLQAAQPVYGWGVMLRAYLQEDDMNYLGERRHAHTERPQIDLYLQLFNGHALIEQAFGQAVVAGRGGHGQLWGQRDECIQVDRAAVGRRPQQRQVRLTRRQERQKSLDDRKRDRENGGYLTPARRCWKRRSTWVLAWDFCVVLFHSMGISRLGWSIYWHRGVASQ